MASLLSRRSLIRALAFGWATLMPAARGLAQTGPRKPKVPPGRDPGGVAVAIIGAGVDYLRPDVAARLARDGEGEMIGWDVIDDDPYPLESAPAKGRSVPEAAGTAAALALLQAAASARLIPVRVPARNALALGGAMAFVARTPARVVVVLGNGGPDEAWDLLARGIARTPQALVVVPAALMANAAAAGLGGPANVVTVTAIEVGAKAPVAVPGGGAPAQIGVPVAAARRLGPGLESDAGIEHLAAIGIAAAAARLLARSPGDDGARIKARLLAARQISASSDQPVEGVIPDPDAIALTR